MPKRATGLGYGCGIEGHGGEGELIVMISPGQNDGTPIIAVAACVDGGLEVIENIPNVPTRNVRAALTKIVRKWGGVSDVNKAVMAIEYHFGYRTRAKMRNRAILNT